MQRIPVDGLYDVYKSTVTPLALGAQGHNGVTYIDKSLVVFNGNQYICYVTSLGTLGVGKRTFPSGTWTTIDTGFSINNAGDSHYNASMGIDSNGYIHLSYGMHDQALIYKKSNNPEDITAFSNGTMTGSDESSVTYPRFFKANNILYFSYRQGTSTVGSQYLNIYDVNTSTWSVLKHKFIDDGGHSVYCDNFAVANDGSIHVSFMWRTNDVTITLSDYSYAYSTDGGSTWKQADGTTQTVPITESNSAKFESGDISGLINQHHIDVDSNNHPHIAYWKNGTNGHANYFHAWHNGTNWVIKQLTDIDSTPTSVITFIERQIARPGILVNRTNNKVYVFTRKSINDLVEVYESVAPYTSWVKKYFSLQRSGWMEFGGFDYDQWHLNQILYWMFMPDYAASPGFIYILRSNFST